ncbi:hypothetical protein HS961_09135 [Comamonas piscis]|uniref:Uncharacterized protein n=1 Tax=Comamonas piscis TaxID=1562974 RepID=A0A7G5EG65_9BURK|nr:hypothetical protein [Comamonas piscis]QMV72990.1 hypothetical protein HS961_09135 [Comamonas piscis]WSO35773.1 hypothetical protein VUJ63_09160 [Comamonas piscis]
MNQQAPGLRAAVQSLNAAPSAQSELEGVLSAMEVELKSLTDSVAVFVERVTPVCRDLPTGEGRDDSKAHASSPIGGRIAAQIDQVRAMKHRINTRIAELAI